MSYNSGNAESPVRVTQRSVSVCEEIFLKNKHANEIYTIHMDTQLNPRVYPGIFSPSLPSFHPLSVPASPILLQHCPSCSGAACTVPQCLYSFLLSKSTRDHPSLQGLGTQSSWPTSGSWKLRECTTVPKKDSMEYRCT